jgi:large subunit ribosomal protein L9
MQVILTSKIKNLGDIGNIVEVKPGYAKNFLFPRKKAIYNSSANLKTFELKKGDIEKGEEELLSLAAENRKKFNNKEIVIIENASDDGRLYGSVNASTIISKLNDLTGLSLTKSDIRIEKPIKEIGIYDMKASLYSDISINISLIVTRNELEIKTLREALIVNNKLDNQPQEEEVEEEINQN